MFPAPLTRLPDWITEPPPQEHNELPRITWGYHAPQMANRSYRPPRLVYRRTEYGDDHRLKYLLYFLDVRDQRVLELGPYEGHHSILLEKLGVRETVSLEARPDNYQKCLHIQQRYRLTRTTFHLSNIEHLCAGTEAPPYTGIFDLVYCLGVLYHLPEPARALRWCRAQAPQLFLGTHYTETRILHEYTDGFRQGSYRDGDHVYDGLWYSEHGVADALSGMSPASFWPTEQALIQMLTRAGYTRIHLLGKDIQNRHPHLTLLAETDSAPLNPS